MYWEVTLKVPNKKNLIEVIEDYLYTNFSQGWETIEEKHATLFKVYVKERSSELEDLERFLAKYLEVEVEYRLIKEENWAELWKAGFRPLKIGKRLVIVPPWEKYIPYSSEEVILFIEPGQAFGTGHHPTTQMMLENIEIFAETLGRGHFKVLDLGCGTGILAITCLKLMPDSKAWAVDIDEEAIKACKHNAILNKVQQRLFVRQSPPETKLDLILANIGYKELKNLANLIKSLSKKGTHLFLTGILKEDANEMERFYNALGYYTIKKQDKKEWSFFWMRFLVA